MVHGTTQVRGLLSRGEGPKFTSSTEDLRDADKNLTLMIQADMTAYRVPGEPMQLGMPELYDPPGQRCGVMLMPLFQHWHA
jgi:hypothetical protein